MSIYPHRYGCHPRWYSPVFSALLVRFVAWFFSLHFLCISLKHNRLQMYYACACLFLISCHVLGWCAFGKRENRLIIAPSSSEETTNIDRLTHTNATGRRAQLAHPHCMRFSLVVFDRLEMDRYKQQKTAALIRQYYIPMGLECSLYKSAGKLYAITYRKSTHESVGYARP